ncbi:amino acid permease, partial [Francisellaceae bacterium]|nr:amino acid permease [Francisellaceae bacterium]
THNDLDAFSGAAALTFWAFIGLESAAVMASKVKNPTKMVPLATITGTLIAAFIYIATSTIIMGMIPAHELMNSTAPFALAASKIIGSSGGVIIAVTAVIACLGTLNGWIMMTAVVSQSMAETKLFPKIFAKQNKHGSPVYGLILQAVFITVLLLFTMSPSLVDQFNLLILIAVLASLIPYFYTAIANVMLGNAKKSITRKGVVISVLASLYALWAIMGSGEKVVYYGMAFLLFGAFIYLIVECKKE